MTLPDELHRLKEQLEETADIFQRSIALCAKDPETEDGYATLLLLLGGIETDFQQAFFLAGMVHFGYSYSAALKVARILQREPQFLSALSLVTDAFSSHP